MGFTVELHVPADSTFAPLVENVVSDAASRCALEGEIGTSLVRAAVLGFSAIVEDAMAESRLPIRLVVTETPVHLRVSLFERGLPLDDEAARRDPRWAQIAASVHEAHWRSHGRSGSELQLEVLLPVGASGNGHADAPKTADVEPAPQQSYEIRRYRPEDGPGVARAFYLTYGYNYYFPAVYVPHRLSELNAGDEYISMVAVAENGEIAGHYALRRDPGTPIAEGCGAIVVPAHRGRNLLVLLREEAQREAQRLGLPAYYTEPVTDHGRTQHESQRFGAHLCGIMLGFAPQSMLAKHMELTATSQRQTFTVYYRPFESRARRTIYVPEHHRAIVDRMYANLDLPVEFGQGEPLEGSGVVRTAVHRTQGTGFVTIERGGADSPSVLRQAASDLRALNRLGAIFVALPLEDPAAPQLCEAAESLGFFFAGIAPWSIGGADALRLQMPLTHIDLSALTIVGDFGQDVLRYIGAERERLEKVST